MISKEKNLDLIYRGDPSFFLQVLLYLVLPYSVLCNIYKQYIADLESFMSRIVVRFYYMNIVFHSSADGRFKFD